MLQLALIHLVAMLGLDQLQLDNLEQELLLHEQIHVLPIQILHLTHTEVREVQGLTPRGPFNG